MDFTIHSSRLLSKFPHVHAYSRRNACVASARRGTPRVHARVESKPRRARASVRASSVPRRYAPELPDLYVILYVHVNSSVLRDSLLS